MVEELKIDQPTNRRLVIICEKSLPHIINQLLKALLCFESKTFKKTVDDFSGIPLVNFVT